MGLDDTIGNKTGDDSLKNEEAKGGLTDIAEQAQDLFTD